MQDDVAVVPPDAEAAADFLYFHAHDFAQVENAGGVFRQTAEAVFQRAEKILLFGIVFRRPPGGGGGGFEPVAAGIKAGVPGLVGGFVFFAQAVEADGGAPAAAEMVGDFVFENGRYPGF